MLPPQPESLRLKTLVVRVMTKTDVLSYLV